MTCSGTDTATGQFVSIQFDTVITDVAAQASQDQTDLWIAPGFVDIQVNGFGGVDFNNPNASLDDIGRAIRLILATGVTRCLPTVITGSGPDMLACLLNLRRAQKELSVQQGDRRVPY